VPNGSYANLRRIRPPIRGGESIVKAPNEQTPASTEVPAAHADLAGADELSSRVFRAFLTTLRLHRQLMTRTLVAHGTHPGQAFCLRLLAANDGMTQRDVAEMLHLSRPTVTKMLQAMEKGGMIARRADAADRRLTHVYLTAGGRAREQALRSVSAAYVHETIGTLSTADRLELARLLEELAESISRALAAGEAAPDAAAAMTGHGETPPDAARAAS
jgi:MarR family transcriptional regulator, organic hydroperoxide resistance regulator